MPSPTRSGIARSRPKRTISLPMVVDSPPGMINPSTPSRSLGRRTSTSSTPIRRRVARCSITSPWIASTPIFIAPALAPPPRPSAAGSPPRGPYTPRVRVSGTSSYGAPSSLATVISSSSGAAWSARMPSITARMWRTASTTFPVPASPFVRIIAAPSPIRRSASPRSRQPHTNGILKMCLLMWYRSSAGVSTSLSSMKSTPSASSTRASTKWPIRALAITGIVTTSMISLTLRGSAIRATPPSARISAGTRSSAITAQAPASSAIFACSAVVTSMMTPPFSICARPRLSFTVPTSAMCTPPVVRIFSTPNPVQTQLRGDPLKGRDDGGDVLLERHAHLLRAFDDILAADALRECLVLHLLLDGRHVDVRQPLRRPDQRHGDHEPAELVGGEQGLLHPGGPGYTAVVRVRQNRPAEALVETALPQQLDPHEGMPCLLRGMLLVVQVVEQTGEAPGGFILTEPPGIRPHHRLHRHHVLQEVRVFRVLAQDHPGLISGHSGHQSPLPGHRFQCT